MEKLKILIGFLFIIIVVIGLSYTFNLSPKQTDYPTTIITPKQVILNEPFTITLNHLPLNTTYQIQFLTNYFLYKTQQTFISNSSTYQTSLTASNEYNFNQSLRIGLFIPIQHSYPLFSIIPIGGSN